MSLTHVLAALHMARRVRTSSAGRRLRPQRTGLRVAEAGKQLQTVRDALRSAHEQATALASAPARYAQALAAKEQYLTRSGDPRAHELLSLADERGRLTGQLNEITEADRAREVCARRTGSGAGSKLGSAGSWSTYDHPISAAA